MIPSNTSHSFKYSAEPVIEEALKQVPAETIFLYVGVGDRAL